MCHAKMYRLFLSNLGESYHESYHMSNMSHTCIYSAVHTGSIVFCVNYRKAPEYPFPAAQLDSFDSTIYIFKNSKKFGFDPNKVILTGDSAGGLLSVNCWYRIYLSKYNFKPAGICLLYPALGYQLDTPRWVILLKYE